MAWVVSRGVFHRRGQQPEVLAVAYVPETCNSGEHVRVLPGALQRVILHLRRMMGSDGAPTQRLVVTAQKARFTLSIPP